MGDVKQGMEAECQRLQENLKELTSNRALIQEEFVELNEMHKQLIVQLRGDTLAGEGQLHAFQSEKQRIEERIEGLEKQLREKTEKLIELDQKASEYLLKVTTASNSLYDEEDHTEQSESNKNLIQQLLSEEMAAEEQEEERHYPDSEEEGSEGEESDTENCSFKLKVNDDSIATESKEQDDATDDDEEEDTTNEITPPTKEQMLTLSSVVTELQRLKDEMGRCITVKDDTLMELEGQLLSTKKELAFLRGSMSDMSFELHRREEGYHSSDRERSVDRRSMSHEEKVDLMHKLNVLESMVVEDRLDLEELVFDRRSSQGSRDRSPSRRSGIRSPSYSSISGRVAMLEKELNDANEKLAKYQRRMRVLAMEKEHKQKECEILQRKVDNVESKMSELQGTFDLLVRAMIVERDDLVKKMNEKDSTIEDWKTKLAQAEEVKQKEVDLGLYIPKDKFESSVEALENKYCDKLSACQSSYEELVTKHSKEVQNLKDCVSTSKEQYSSLIEDLKIQVANLESDCRSESLKFKESQEELEKGKRDCLELKSSFDSEIEKNIQLQFDLDRIKTENVSMLAKCHSLESKVSDAALPLQEEVKELQNNLTNIHEEKTDLENRLSSLQEEYEALLRKNEGLASLVEKFEKDSLEFGSMENLKRQLEEQQQKLTALNSMNDNLNSKINNRDQEIREELNAREATIQELRITLTNNQKQSRENYQMLQDDMAALQIRIAKEREESQAVIIHLKEKIIKAEEDADKKQMEIENLKKQLEEAETEVQSVNEETSAPSGGTSSENFEAQMALKVEKINELEEKVNQLEVDLEERVTSLEEKEEKVRELEKKLRESAPTDTEHYKTRFEEQIAQIKKLQNYIDTLKSKVDSLSEESWELKQAVTKLQSEKESIEEEKNSLVRELEESKSSNEVLENDLETKKNLVEELKFKVSSIEVVLETPSDVNFSLIDRLDKVEKRIQSSISADNEKYLTKISDLEKEILELKMEKDSKDSNKCSEESIDEKCLEESGVKYMEEASIGNEDSLSKQIEKLKLKNKNLAEEKMKLTKQFEYEQNKALEMQNDMVNDLESLILNLEKEKKELEEDLKLSQSRMAASATEYETSLKEIKEALSLTEKERDNLRHEVENLKGSESEYSKTLIEDLTKKVNLLRIQNQETERLLQESEFKFEELLSKERAVYEKRIENLRRDLREEMDIMEQQKDDIRQEMRWEMERLASEWALRLEASEKKKTTQLLEEKARFGRVLVGKNDEYEKLAEERRVEIKGYQDRLTDLQAQLEEKLNIVDELETNMDEIICVRSNLEEKLNLLKDALLTSKVDGVEGAAELAKLLKSLEKQVQEMESSNTDLKQKIDGLQAELTALEILAKDGNSSEERLIEEKRKIEDEKRIAEEKRRVIEEEKKVIEEEKRVFEEEMKGEVSRLTERIQEMKFLEENQLEQMTQMESEGRQLSDRISYLTDREKKYESDIARLSVSEQKYLSRIVQLAEEEVQSKSCISQLKKETRLKSDKLSELEDRESDYLKKISDLKENLIILQQRIEDARIYNEINEELERKLSCMEEELTEERGRVSILAQEIEDTNSKKEDLAAALEAEHKQCQSMMEQLNSLSEEAAEHQKLHLNLTQTLDSIKEELKTKEELAFTLSSQLREKENLLQSLNSLLKLTDEAHAETDIRDIVNNIKNERENLKEELEKELSQKESLRIEINDAKNELEKLYSEVECLKEENSELAKELELQKIKVVELSECSNRSLSDEQRASLQLESGESDILLTKKEQLIQETLETCRSEMYAEFEEKLNELRKRHEEERGTWKQQNLRKEEETKGKIEALTAMSNNERKEIEKLTRVAANAFRSGTESVDLLKEQVMRQRIELEEIKRNHKKEIEEFQNLLEVKRRRGRGDHDIHNAGALEDAAEFEYLRNILYQYMIGKETQTLSKVLCAVVKFNKDQQRQVIEHEDRKQNLLNEKLRLELEIRRLRKPSEEKKGLS